jgi:hypothetical protein
LPFHGSPDEIAVEHAVTPPPPLHTHLPTLSPDVERVILTALAKRPEERFASISDFAAALEQASGERRSDDERLPSFSISSPADMPFSLSSAIRLQQPVDLLVESKPAAVPSTPSPAVELHTPPALPIAEKKTDKPVLRSWFRAVKRQVLSPLVFAVRTIKNRIRGGGQQSASPLRSVAFLKLEEDNRAVVGKWYTIEAGITLKRRGRFTRGPTVFPGKDPSEPLWFTMILHTTSENIVIDYETGYQHLLYDLRNLKPQLVPLSFRFVMPGHGFVAVDFFYEQGWYKRLRFEIDTVEQPVGDAATETRGNGVHEL